MTDIHTHILPGIDDGAATLDQSLAMLRSCREQGVDTVVLTPHFYPWTETLESFLQRRNQAFQTLTSAIDADMPQLVLGAEIAWYPSLDTMTAVDKLTLGGSNFIMVEMPNAPWTQTMLSQLYRLSAVMGVTPVLAHVERYLHLQKEGQMKTLREMGVVLQLSAGMLLKPVKRRKALTLLHEGVWMLGSDCHDMELRPPCMGPAVEQLEAHHPGNAEVILDWQP